MSGKKAKYDDAVELKDEERNALLYWGRGSYCD
jgi:hypothetical protein